MPPVHLLAIRLLHQSLSPCCICVSPSSLLPPSLLPPSSFPPPSFLLPSSCLPPSSLLPPSFVPLFSLSFSLFLPAALTPLPLPPHLYRRPHAFPRCPPCLRPPPPGLFTA
ncbi:unnamed protein product [Closterium sp. NIES-53]